MHIGPAIPELEAGYSLAEDLSALPQSSGKQPRKIADSPRMCSAISGRSCGRRSGARAASAFV